MSSDSHGLLMVQRWMLHHKTALAGMEGGFSCWCYTKNVSSAFSHIISVGRTQEFLKLPIRLLFKKRFSFDFKRILRRLTERGGEGLL